MNNIHKVGLGGGCHWCTEGVFQSLIGVEKVEQGWISSDLKNKSLSEAVLVHYNPNVISLHDLIEIHLYTHSSTSLHGRRDKYRSAVYVFSKEQKKNSSEILNHLQKHFDKKIITEVLDFGSFKMNIEEQLNYFYQDPEKPFCKTYIKPKLSFLLKKYSKLIDESKYSKFNL